MVGAKATKTAQALSRIMPNVGGPSTSKRKLVTSVVHSQLLYAAPIWVPLLDKRPNSVIPIKGNTAKHIESAQRLMGLRVTRAYRTVSFKAATLVASMIPITLLAKERITAHNSTHKRQSLEDTRKDTMMMWQRDWDNTEKGRWTHTLIRNVEKWVSRGFGDVDYFLTQFFTNHGCFNAYLNKIKKIDSPKCSLCGAEFADAKHTIFECDAFVNWRRQLFVEIGRDLTPQNVVDNMLEGKRTWLLISTFIHRAMKYKCEAERTRQAAAPTDN